MSEDKDEDTEIFRYPTREEDIEEKTRLLTDIEKAIPKYQKTLNHLDGLIEFWKDNKTLQDNVKEKKKNLEKTITDLSIAKKIFANILTKYKSESETLPESHAKLLEDYFEGKKGPAPHTTTDEQAKIVVNETGKFVLDADKSNNDLMKELRKQAKKTRVASSQSKRIAMGALVLTISITIGITLLTQGTSTHTQLDIFLLSNNLTEFDQNKNQNFENLRGSADFKQRVGTIVLLGGYLLGAYVMTQNLENKKSESAGGSKSSRQAELETYEKDYLARLERQHN